MFQITCPDLMKFENIRHGFFGRRGGHSAGIYQSLNCGTGSDDQPENIKKNRQAVLSSLGSRSGKLYGLYQIHSNIVHYLESPPDENIILRGDAMVTGQKNMALGILTADCIPVLLADPANEIIAAAHGGWKGVLSGILENTVQTMCDKGAERSNIIAVTGPCIAQENYEVGPEFIDSFLAQDPAHQQFFTPSSREKHCMFDLPGYLIQRLERANVAAVSSVEKCTYALEDQFFSYRRATHRGEEDYGRQISVITLT